MPGGGAPGHLRDQQTSSDAVKNFNHTHHRPQAAARDSHRATIATICLRPSAGVDPNNAPAVMLGAKRHCVGSTRRPVSGDFCPHSLPIFVNHVI
jgi:hypothetical protein